MDLIFFCPLVGDDNSSQALNETKYFPKGGYLSERTLKMMILRDDDGWARIGGSHSGGAKGRGVSGGERFGGCVLSLGMRGHVNRKVNLRGRGEKR